MLAQEHSVVDVVPGNGSRRLVVAGAGYVGLATATGFARRGHQVDVVEVDHERAACLRRAQIPFHEPSLSDAFAAEIESERIRIHDGYGRHLGTPDFAFICTPTPSREDGHLDTSYVYSAAGTLLETCRDRLRLVVRSTVNPGTTRDLSAWALSRHAGVSVLVNPEFLREGFSLIDFEAPSRVVIGGEDRQAVDELATLYTFAGGGMIRTDPTTAEIIKLGSNSALAVRVSLANEVAHLADSFGADVETVLGGIGEDPRIGRAYLTPGIGFGGSCLPKDLSALRATALRQGVATAVFDGAQRTNDLALERLIERAIASRGDRETARISVIGAAFKPGSDSVRNSRAILLIRALIAEGFSVCVFDPPAEAGARIELGDGIVYAPTLQEALNGSDLGIVVDRTLLNGASGRTADVTRLIDSLGREVMAP